MSRQEIFELVRDRLADILEIEPVAASTKAIPSPTTSRPTRSR